MRIKGGGGKGVLCATFYVDIDTSSLDYRGWDRQAYLHGFITAGIRLWISSRRWSRGRKKRRKRNARCRRRSSSSPARSFFSTTKKKYQKIAFLRQITSRRVTKARYTMMIGNPNLLLFFIVRWAKPLRSRKKKEILHRLSLFYFLQKKLMAS